MHSDPLGKEILFHHPLPVLDDPRTGSQIRPRRMLDAFRAIGYEVTEVTGYSRTRIPAMRNLAREIRAGRRFEFCYSECVTSPTALSDPGHLPLHPLADPIFFRALRANGIPSGLFYRDVYWRFEEYRRSVTAGKRLAATSFHRFDLAWYARYVDVVYLPSLGMAGAIPGSERLTLKELPPGAMLTPHGDGTTDLERTSAGMRLFYVGSVAPPIYDITMLLRSVANSPAVALTVCFPEAELSIFATYPADITRDVEIHHSTGEALHDLYARADAACLIMGPHPYRDFAMPVKLFEAVGHGLPLISNSRTAAGRFVGSNDLGWVFDDEDALRQLLARLVENPDEVRSMQDQVRRTAPEQTWEGRARQVARDLSGVDR